MIEKILQFIFENFLLIWFLCLIWVVGNFAFKHYRNKKKGLYFEDPDARDVVYSEKFASGRSHKSFKTKFGGASNCLRIMVTPDELYVRPFFPFLILGPYFDLIHSIPIRKITGIRKASGFMSQGLDISFIREDATEGKITIASKKESELKVALEETKKNQSQPSH